MEKTSFKNNQKSYSKRHSSLKKKVTNDKNDNSLLTIYSFISNYMLKEEVNYDENDNRYILLESQDFENESGLKKVSFGEFNEKSYSLSHKRKKQNEEDIDKEEEVYENVDQADYEEEDYEEEDYEEEDYEEDDYEEDDYEEEDYEEDDYQDDDYQDDDYQLNDDEDAEKPYNYDPNQIDSKNVNNDHSINSTNIKQNNSIIRRVGKKKKNKIYNNDNFPNEEDIQIDHNMNEENHSRQLWKKKRKKKRKRAKKNMYTNMKNKEIDNNKKGIYKGNNLAKYFTLSMENINEQENIFKDEKQLSRQMSYYNDAYYYTSEMIYKNNRRNKEKFALYLRLMSLFINIIIGIYLIIYFPHTNNDKDTFDGTFKNMDIKDREDIKHIISKNLEINKDYHNYMKKVNLNVSILNKQKELFENKSIINGKANTNTNNNTNTNSSNNNRMHVNAFDRNSNNNDSVINTNNTNNNNNSNNFVRFLRNIFSSNNYEQEDNLKSLPNSINKEKTNNNTSITNTGYYNLYKNNNNNNNIIDVEKNIYDENDKNNNLKKKNLKNVKSNNYNSGVYYVNDKDMLKDIKTKEDINNLIYMIDILNLMDDEHIMIYIYNEMNKIYKYAIYSFFGELLVISIIVFSLFILKILINDNNKFSVILTMYGIFYKIFCYIFAHYVLFMGLYILSIYYNIYIHRDIYTHSYNFFCYHYVYNNLYIHLLMLFYALQNIVFTINDAFNCIRMVFILIKHVIIKIYEKITCKNFITFYELKEDKSPLSLTCFNKLKNKCNMNCKCCKDKNCVEIDIDEMHDLEYEKNKLPLFPNFNRKPYCKNLNIKTYEQSLLNMRNPIFK